MGEPRIELLSPVGDFERLCFAIEYGADAVYLGADEFGMRASPKNFSLEELEKAVDYAHDRGVKVYLTLNTVPTNDDVRRMPQYVERLRDAGVDAFIVADLGVLALVKQLAPQTQIHLSTQVGIMNYAAATAAYNLGATRVVLARELSLQEIEEIRLNTPAELELEAFVHGAMCVSISGRCLLSNYLTGRDANRGECAQPCRWNWHLVEQSRPNTFLEIGEEDEGSYILNADDLCMAPYLNMLAQAGVTSFKIEGRAKSFYYVASVTAAYRRALDAFLQDPINFMCPIETLEELTKTSHRRYSTGFYFGRDGATANSKTGGYIREWDVVAVVEASEQGMVYCTQRGKFAVGDELEVLLPNGEVSTFTAPQLFDENGVQINETPHAMMKFSFKYLQMLPKFSILRKRTTGDR